MCKLEPPEIIPNATKEQILNQLSKRQDLKNIIFSIAKNDKYYQEELYQEVFLILCEKDADKIQKAYREKYLDFKILKIAMNQVKDKYSTFYKTKFSYSQIDPFLENNLTDTNSQDEFLFMLQDLEDELKKIKDSVNDPYNRNILDSYLKNENQISKTSKALRVNKHYVRESIKKTKQKLKEIIINKAKERNK